MNPRETYDLLKQYEFVCHGTEYGETISNCLIPLAIPIVMANPYFSPRRRVVDDMYMVYGRVSSRYIRLGRSLEHLKEQLGEGNEGFQLLSQAWDCVCEIGDALDELITSLQPHGLEVADWRPISNISLPKGHPAIKRFRQSLVQMHDLDLENEYRRILEELKP